jgi:cytochrome c-type biogenesis protein
LKILGAALLFVLGFSTVFILLGASATFFGRMLASHAIVMMRISGALLILMGLHVTGLLQIPFLMYEKRYQTGRRENLISAFFIGAAFAFGWTPCVGPILASILALAGTQATLGQGVILLALYSLGLGIPFLIAALVMERFLAWMRRFKTWFRGVEVASGLLLIFLGAVMIAGGMLRFASYLSVFNRFAI